MSKGSKQRPTDLTAYNANYDRIFSNKKMVRAYEVNGVVIKDKAAAWDSLLEEVEFQLNHQWDHGGEWEHIKVNIKCVWVEDKS